MNAPSAHPAALAMWRRRAARERFARLPEGERPRDVADAYLAQADLGAIVSRERGQVVGYKIALTSVVMQRFVGVHEPLSGQLFAETVRPSGTTVAASAYVHLGVECEIAVKMGQYLPPRAAPYTQDEVMAKVEACATALEIVDDRSAEYRDVDVPTIIVDNCFGAGAVIDRWRTDWRGLDLAALVGVLEIDGAYVAEGRGQDVLGHPFAAVAWLASHLSGRGIGLARGDVVMTGSIVTTRFVRPGHHVRFRLSELGEAHLQVVE